MSEELIRQEITPVIEKTHHLVIVTPEAYLMAGEYLKDIKWGVKKVKEHFAPMKTATHAAWKAVCAKENEFLEPLEAGEKRLKTSMIAWQVQEENRRLEEQRRLQAQADEIARRERERLEKEAARLKTPELKEQRLEQAAEVQAPQVHVAPITPTVAGQSLRKTWKAVVDDPQQAVKALLEWPDWASYIALNQTELNKLATRTKGALSVPGVRIVEEMTLSSVAERRAS